MWKCKCVGEGRGEAAVGTADSVWALPPAPEWINVHRCGERAQGGRAIVTVWERVGR